GGLDGAGQTVVFLEIDSFQASDIETFSSTFGLPQPVITGPVTNTAWGSAQPATASDEPTEATLDLEVVHALAPEAHLVVYESDNSGADMLAALQAAVDAYPHAVFSYSLGITACSGSEIGEDPATAAQFDSVLEQLDRGKGSSPTIGGTALLSTGDTGAYSCPGSKPGIQMPADSQWATAVGGTTAFIGAGNTYGEEYAWGDPVEQSGDGGGVSTVFKRPPWQVGPGVTNQFSDAMRQIPDVSAIADLTTGWDIYSSLANPQWQVIGGTSAAAPLWAALIALTDQALAERGLQRVGFANPALYDFGANPGKFPAKAYHDVTAGDNLYYPATPGWDFATGWGTPDASAVVDDFISWEKGTR
ncbi:MAG TPA: S53 family peptidase, partial [Acidimicrobiales bacterium]|nr:S53 family peptidase [Acidimicrobiales bacterium]